MNISSIGITGPNGAEFSQTNSCGASVPAGQSCTISVTFIPTVFGSASASLNVSDNIGKSPQTVALSGTGSGPAVSLSPSAVSFPSQFVGTSGLPQTVTLTNTGTDTLTIANVTGSPADFGVLNACGSSLAAGASCSIGVFFDPTKGGKRKGTLTVTDNAGGSPQSVSLSGTGQDFSMAASGSSTATVSPGQTASYSIAVSPVGGFNQTVTLSCSGAPAGSTCAVPASVALNGSTAAMVTVTVTTPTSTGSLTHPNGLPWSGNRLAVWLALPGLSGLLFFGGQAGRSRKRFGWTLKGLVVLCLFALAITLTACGGSTGSNAATYSLKVTGTFAANATTLTRDTELTLVVK